MNKKLMIDYARKLMDKSTVLDHRFSMQTISLTYDTEIGEFFVQDCAQDGSD